VAFDEAVQNFNNFDQQDNKLHDLFRLYCEYAPQSSNLNIQTCWNAFNEALYSTLRMIFNGSGTVMNADTQFAWRCFTNDLTTPDITGAYEARRPSKTIFVRLKYFFIEFSLLGTSGASRNSARAGGAPTTGAATTAAPPASKKGAGGRDKVSDDKTSSKQPPQLAASLSTTELQGDFALNSK
jgi:hypothetical protein